MEDVNALNVVHTEAFSGMGGREKGFLPEAASLGGLGREILPIGWPYGEPGSGASRAGAPFEVVQMTPESIFMENDG